LDSKADRDSWNHHHDGYRMIHPPHLDVINNASICRALKRFGGVNAEAKAAKIKSRFARVKHACLVRGRRASLFEGVSET
jgi:hypothetical protein